MIVAGWAGWGLPEVLLVLKNVILLKVAQSPQENPLVHESSVSMFLFFFWNRSHIDFRASAFTSNPSLCTGFHGNYTLNRSQGFAPMRPGAHQEKKKIISSIQHYVFLYPQKYLQGSAILTDLVWEAMFPGNLICLLQIYL